LVVCVVFGCVCVSVCVCECLGPDKHRQYCGKDDGLRDC